MLIAPFPANTRQYVEAIINQIARDVTFYIVDTLSGCSLCSLDPISNTSTDSFCPLCSGEYWIPTYSGATMSGYVKWGQSEHKDWETGGKIDNGDCIITVLHTAERESIIYSSEYVIVDDREMNFKDIILRGVPQINRILVVLKEKEK